MPVCRECEAIREEMLELIEYSRQSKPGQMQLLQQLAAWFDEREADENYIRRQRP